MQHCTLPLKPRGFRMVIDIGSKLRSPFRRHLYRLAAPLIERGLGIRDFNHLYERTRARYRLHADYPSARAWFNSALVETRCRYEADLPPNFAVPQEGPLIVVSNHPFGILDPVILGDFVSRWRPNIRFLTNFLLAELEEMRPWIIAVDPFQGGHSAQRNLAPMKEALRFLRTGGALAIFPSGEVAHFRMGRGIEESPWSNHLGALVRRTQATVLPVFFEGHNGVLFQTAGLVHPMLRTGLLLRELFARSRELVRLVVGSPIPFARLRKFGDDESLTRYLRLHAFVLGQRPRGGVVRDPGAEAGAPVATVAGAGVDRPGRAAAALEDEVARLRDSGALLAAQGNLGVYVGAAPEIPGILREIGRLREIAFREVGEGTGEEIDLDRFDDYYLHLFLWDEEKRRVAGAYRLGRADAIVRQFGTRGLYTSTLFRFRKPFLQHLADALEMGRSFVVPEYQRSLHTLPLLWRGICAWVSRHPHYRKLFGPVSISQAYGKLSRKLIVEFLRDNKLHPDFARLVRPRKPFRYLRNRKFLREFISADLGNLDDFSALISSMEDDGKGIPVLLKHYLRLNGTLISFNVDKSFSSCLDGLIMVDLTEADPRLLAKYMGDEASRDYLRFHGRTGD